MKYLLLLLICSCSIVYGQDRPTKAQAQRNIPGYWKLEFTGNTSGTSSSSKDQVLIINDNFSMEYFEGQKRLAWGYWSVDSMILLKFNTTMAKNTRMIQNPYEVVSISGYIAVADSMRFVFGYSPVDAEDSYYKRMTNKEIEQLYGSRLLKTAFRWKSEKAMTAWLNQAYKNSPGLADEYPQRTLEPYEAETYRLFNDFCVAHLSPQETPRFTLIPVRAPRVSVGDFGYPNEAALDSFVNNTPAFRDLPSKFADKSKYRAYVTENIPKDYLISKYYGLPSTLQKIPLYHFHPTLDPVKNISAINLTPRCQQVLQKWMMRHDRKYKNWLFIKQFLCERGGVQYDVTDVPIIREIIFSKNREFAFVSYTYPYSDVLDFYQKKDGKWVFHSTVQHVIE